MHMQDLTPSTVTVAAASGGAVPPSGRWDSPVRHLDSWQHVDMAGSDSRTPNCIIGPVLANACSTRIEFFDHAPLRLQMIPVPRTLAGAWVRRSRWIKWAC